MYLSIALVGLIIARLVELYMIKIRLLNPVTIHVILHMLQLFLLFYYD